MQLMVRLLGGKVACSCVAIVLGSLGTRVDDLILWAARRLKFWNSFLCLVKLLRMFEMRQDHWLHHIHALQISPMSLSERLNWVSGR